MTLILQNSAVNAVSSNIDCEQIFVKKWLPVATACIAARLLPILIQKTFPFHPDQYPLANLRYQMAYVHWGMVRQKYPNYFRFVHVHLKDNFHIAVFLIASYLQRQDPERFFEEVPLMILSAGIIVTSSTALRMATCWVFRKVAQLSSENGYMERFSLLLSRALAPSEI